MNYFRKPNIGFIGLGFVGGAVAASYNLPTNFVNRDPAKGWHASYNELKECEGIFISVPSPSNPDGSCDTSILESELAALKGYKGVVISKVTAPPDVYKRLGEEYENLVYIPEFLTAANAEEDYRKENFIIVGGTVLAYQREAERIIKYAKPEVSVSYCSPYEASFVKYTINSFLATKVVFMNEMQTLVEATGGRWDVIAMMLEHDKRVGASHIRVPGSDGQYGFGGMCFPKDTSAIIYYANKVSADLNVLSAAVKKNTLLRLKKPK